MSEFFIIGAGINGLLLARELAQIGASVTLIDKGTCGCEASWAGGGIVSPLYPWRYHSSITALATWAQSFYPLLAQRLHDETGIDPELNQSGLLMLDAADEPAALKWAEKADKPMFKLGCSEVQSNEPMLSKNFESALHMPHVANIRNPRLCRALAESLRAEPKVQIIENKNVAGLTTIDDRISKLNFKKNDLSLSVADSQVIMCAGAWTNDLLTLANFKSEIKPIKGQMLLFKLAKAPVRSIVLSAGKYLIPRRDGHLLVGSTLEDTGFDKSLSEEGKENLLTAAREMLPQLENFEPIGHWSGLRPGSTQGVPLIGKVPGWENLFINAGQFRNGLVLAPASARLMADILLNREKSLDPKPYDPEGRLAPYAI